MAVRTSTQSGNFNSTATWGGNAVPVDADQFIVSADMLLLLTTIEESPMVITIRLSSVNCTLLELAN